MPKDTISPSRINALTAFCIVPVWVVFAMDGNSDIKARLRPGVAARDVKRRKARKITDNLIQYFSIWSHRKTISLPDDEMVLLNTVSLYTRKPGWVDADKNKIKELFCIMNV